MKLFANQQRRARPGTRRTQPVTRPRSLRRRTKVLLGAAALVTGVVAFAAYLYVHYVHVMRYSAAQGRVTVERADLGQLGTVLVTNKGFALYTFPPDAAQHVTCTGGCATAWPPVIGKPSAAMGVRLTGKLGTITRAGGMVQATYKGHPLYLYAGDTAPGQVKGNGLGGVWHVLHVSAISAVSANSLMMGAASSASPKASSSMGSGGSGGGGY